MKEKYIQNQDLCFLKYDLSNPFTILDSLKIAKKLGVQDIYKAQRFSGVVLIIDSKEKKVLSTLVAEYNLDTYVDAIESIFKSSSENEIKNET